ncbi:hypothetical protein V8F33_007788 [Rhypophila sp. PSN 637]
MPIVANKLRQCDQPTERLEVSNSKYQRLELRILKMTKMIFASKRTPNHQIKSSLLSLPFQYIDHNFQTHHETRNLTICLLLRDDLPVAAALAVEATATCLTNGDLHDSGKNRSYTANPSASRSGYTPASSDMSVGDGLHKPKEGGGSGGNNSGSGGGQAGGSGGGTTAESGYYHPASSHQPTEAILGKQQGVGDTYLHWKGCISKRKDRGTNDQALTSAFPFYSGFDCLPGCTDYQDWSILGTTRYNQ